MDNEKVQTQKKRPHIFEIDLIRAITVFSVVAIHSLSYTTFLTTSTAGRELINLIGHSLHFNREMFMFVTGLVLTYVYYHRPFSAKKFWLKRAFFVVVPYAVWSILYVFLNNPWQGWPAYLKLSAWNIFTGDASFQLYYILLSVQFYLIFPLFLLFLKKIERYPWQSLAIGLVVQLVFLYIDFNFLQIGPYSSIPTVKAFVNYQDRFFFIYEFFFLLGGFAAIYMDSVRTFLRAKGKYIGGVFFVSLTLYALYYYRQVLQLGFSPSHATSVLQPVVVLYSTVVIVFIAWLTLLWEKKKKFYGLVKVISDTSFGIYLVHVLMLTYVVRYFLPLLSPAIPVPVKDVSVLLIAFGLSVILCYIFLKIPLLSWTIGRARAITIPHAEKIKLATVKAYNQIKPFRNMIWIIGLSIIFMVGAIRLATLTNLTPQHNFISHPHPRYISQQQIKRNTPQAFFPEASQESMRQVVNKPIQSTGCNARMTLQAGTATNVGLKSGQTQRMYRVYLPPSYSNLVPHALIMNFHGYGGSAYSQERDSEFDTIANVNNVVIVYPEGSEDKNGLRGWNTGLHPSITANDVLFVSDMLNQLQSNLCINLNQIYATGFSNGGGFVNMLACTLSNRIAAFAPVSGSYVTSAKNCKVSRPVSLMEVHGSADTVVPYQGNIEDHEPSILSWATSWAQRDDCHTKPHISDTEKNMVRYSWTGCKSQSTVINYKLLGGEHEWPDVHFTLNKNGHSKKVTINNLIWQFFQQHPLKTKTTPNTAFYNNLM
jgi:poly(3-hydroxybutyrate) depolymerase/surface polysaccharide O-acyltransferase-like enzyme